MPVYCFMFGWVIMGGILSNITSKEVCISEGYYEKRANLVMAFITFSVIIFFAGLRSYGVSDTGAYIQMFKSYPKTFVNFFSNICESDNDKIGFIILSTFIKKYISTNYNIWLFIIAFISGICIMSTLCKYSSNFGVSIFLFMASCQFTWMFNGMRQYLAVAILFFSTRFILDKKPLKYLLIILLATTIHKTSILMIPVYFIVQGEPWNKRTMIVIFTVILCLLFSNKFLKIFDSMINETEYAISYQENKKFDDGVNAITIMVQSIPVLIAFLFKDKLRDKYTAIIKLSINMSIIGVCVYIISKLVSSGILIGRIPIYFTIYNIILMPWVLNNSFEKNERRLIYFIMIICYLILFYYQLYITWNGWPYISEVLGISV